MIQRLCLLLTLLLFCSSVAQAEMVSISTNKAKIHTSPKENSPAKWELGKGYPLKVIARKGNWLKVVDYANDGGWVSKKQVSSTPYGIVAKKKIEIRDEPADTQQVIGNANEGVVLRIMKQKKDWVQVKHESGLIGWARADALWGCKALTKSTAPKGKKTQKPARRKKR